MRFAPPNLALFFEKGGDAFAPFGTAKTFGETARGLFDVVLLRLVATGEDQALGYSVGAGRASGDLPEQLL